MTGRAFVDCETTGLDPDRHEIWELAIVTDETTLELHLPVRLSTADPMALRIGRFYERRAKVVSFGIDPGRILRSRWAPEDKFAGGLDVAWYAQVVASMLDGLHIVGCVPHFDAAFLTRWLNRNGQAATWHYHLIDVEAMAVGYLAGAAMVVNEYGIPVDDEIEGEDSYGHDILRRAQNTELPWRSDELSRACGVEPPGPDERHTALGDALWAKRWYEAIIGGAS